MRRFLFHLARTLGMTVADLSRRMSAAELAEWQAFLALEAAGEAEAATRSGLDAGAHAALRRQRGR